MGTRNRDGQAPEVRYLTPADAVMAHITINQYLQQVGFARDPRFLAMGMGPGAGSDPTGGRRGEGGCLWLSLRRGESAACDRLQTLLKLQVLPAGSGTEEASRWR